jgi:hypothetical protein
MIKDWREYQQVTAELFSSLGLESAIDHTVEGARGVHNVDVWVTFKYLGLEIKWLIECKFWQTAVPKSTVLTLQQIAQDVGADRAFLMSETGFQSGALKVTQNTNITLTSLEDLRVSARGEILNASLTAANRRIAELDGALKHFMMDENGKPFPCSMIDMDEILTASGAVFLLRLSIQKAFAQDFPITFHAVETCESVVNPNLETFVNNLTAAISDLSDRVKRLELQAEAIRQKTIYALKDLLSCVEELMSVAELALFSFPENDPRFEQVRLQSLAAIKAVGRASEKLRDLAFGKLRSDVSSLMRLLIDTVYLHLSQPTISATDWELTKRSVSERLPKLKQWTIDLEVKNCRTSFNTRA